MLELQNAYALSRAEHDPLDAATRAALNAGRFVVVITGTAHCRFTDAVIGSRSVHVSDHATREDADRAANAIYEADDWSACEDSPEVLPRLPAAADLCDDIPF